jgi:septal ring factor EnvC (AmiA/AmiB activator)
MNLFAQSRIELDRRKKENIDKLETSRIIMEKMTEEKTASLNRITLVQKNIEIRANLVSNISDEIEILQSDIEFNNAEISNLGKRIEVLKNEYAELIRGSYKLLENDYALIYIITAQDMNQGYLRMKYLKYLVEYRKDLIKELENSQNRILELNTVLRKNKVRNEELIQQKAVELKKLDNEKQQNEKLIKSLSLKQEELKQEIRRRERMMIEIEREINKVIAEEERKLKGKIGLAREDMNLAAEFGKNEGRLPWPAEKGVISGNFGEQNHPVLKDIKVKSYGIDISTIAGSKVRTVFDGVVSKVIAILGANYTVIIRHGDYFTVYQNLVDVNVKSGDKVKTGDLIGTVYTGPDNIAKVHFEIWKERKILNPEIWLRK